jgi:hypothetical protein
MAVTLYTRIPGRETFSVPQVNGAVTVTPPAFACTAYMQHPYGQGDVTWNGAQFGMPAPGGSGAQVQRITVTVTHNVSDPASFSAATAQILAGATPVGSPATLSLSATPVSDTFKITTGYTAAQLPNLAVQLNYHAIAPSLANVVSVYAQASYSYPAAVTPFTTAPRAVMPAPAVSVGLPPVTLASLGAQVFSLAPAFGRPTAAGNLLIGWAYSNSGSSSFDTTCSDPAWTLGGYAGAAFGWTSFWYKTNCGAAEVAPSFSSGASQPMSQLAEFTCTKGVLDQVTATTGSQSYTATAAAADTRSGDLVVALFTWGGANNGPATIGMTGTDSSGAALPLTLYSNASTTGTQFWALGWGQAGQPFGPHTDTASSTLNLYATGQAIVASFSVSSPAPAPSGIRPVTGQVNVMPWVMQQPGRAVTRPAVPPVTITTTGSAFSPWVAAPPYVTVTWSCPAAGITTTGLTPVLSFGSTGTRTVYMTATDASGNDALNQITLFNIGFDSTNDVGRYSLPSSYNWTAQAVSGITNVNSMTGLQLFLAANITTLAGPVIFDGMARMTNIECYNSRFTSATVRGCASLLRCVIEQNNLTQFDPSPVAPTLGEMRLAFQQSGTLTLPAGLTNFPNLYHWCVRDQTVTNMPSFASGFPSLSQLWIWNTGQSGTLTVGSSVPMDSVLAHDNAYTTANLGSLFPYIGGQLTGQIAMANNALASVTITGDGQLYSVDFSNNLLPQAQVDSVLTTMNGYATTDALGVINVSGTGNAAPSATGTSAKNALISRSWTVTTN